MSRASTIFLLLSALVVGILVAVLVPLKKSGGKPVGGALFEFDPDDINLIKITNGEEVFELRRTDEGWFTGPLQIDRASVDAIRRLMESARSTPILDRIDAGEIGDRDELSAYGLKRSRVQFDFRGDKDLPLLIGKDAVDETRAYVRFEDSQHIYLIPDELVTLIQSPPQDFRDRMPLRVRPDRVDRIVIRRTAGEIELKREARGWQLIKPLAAPASAPAVEAFLDKVLRMRVEGFEADTNPGVMGLAEPVAEVQLYGEGESLPETIKVGTPSPQGGVFVRLEPRGVTARLPDAISKVLALDLASLRDHSLARINPDLVDMIRVTTPAGSFQLRRRGDGWVIGEKPASEAVVQRMLEALAESKSTGFEPATPDVLKKSGLAQPALGVDFFSVVSENTPETMAGEQLVTGLKFGKPLESGLVPALVTGSPEISFVPQKILEAIPLPESAWQAH